MAVRTFFIAHQLLQLGAQLVILRLAVASDEVRDDTFKWFAPWVHLSAHPVVENHLLIARAIEQKLLDVVRQVLPGRGQAELVLLSEAAQVVVVEDDHAMAALAPQGDGTLFDGKRRVGHNRLWRENQAHPKAIASGAGSIRGVEGEVARQWLAEAQVAVDARQVLAHLLLPPAAFRIFVLNKQRQDAIALFEGQLHGIRQSAAFRVPCDQTVHDRLDSVSLGLRKSDILLQGLDLTIDAHTGEAVAAHLLDNLLVFALAPIDVGRQKHDSQARRHGGYLLADALRALAVDFTPALRAMWYADVRIEQAQVVVNLRGRGDD